MILVNQNLIFVIIGIALVSVIPLAFFGFTEEEKSSEGVIRLIEAPPDIGLDEKLRNFETNNPNADKILSQCGSDKHCAVEALSDLATNEPQPVVLEALSDITTAYNDLGYYCHGAAHHLGMFVFGLTQNMTEALEFAK